MPTKLQPKQLPIRRTPTQSRARQTQSLIFEAAIRVLEEEGLSGFNTNRVAEVAGYSIGTLYQYFRDKHELLEALARHEQERVIAEMQQLLQQRRLTSESPGARVSAVLVIVRKVFGGRKRARRLVLEWALRFDRVDGSDRPVVAMTERLLTGVAVATGGTPLAPAEAFVLTHAVAGAILSALMRKERLLGDPEFEAALVALVLGFMQHRDQS